MNRLWLLLLSLTACVPGTVPALLSATPGPPVIVADQVYRGVDFTVRYPAGWRVITSAAASPAAVIFAAPENEALIYIGPEDTPSLSETARTMTETVRLTDGREVRAGLSADPEVWEAVWPLFQQVTASLQAISSPARQPTG